MEFSGGYVPLENSAVLKMYRRIVLPQEHGSTRKRINCNLVLSDTGLCCYCGLKLKKHKDQTIDHVFPVSRGGGNRMENKVAACYLCNVSKSNKLPLDFLINDGLALICY